MGEVITRTAILAACLRLIDIRSMASIYVLVEKARKRKLLLKVVRVPRDRIGEAQTGKEGDGQLCSRFGLPIVAFRRPIARGRI